MRRPASLLPCSILIFGVLAVVLVACGDDGSDTGSTDPLAGTCLGAALQGDLDCNGSVDSDNDRDGIPTPFDRFPAGDDFADFDGDGFANWADAFPSVQTQTVSDLIRYATPQAALQSEEAELLDEARKLAEQNAGYQVVIDALDREQAEWETRNSDTDALPDIYDSQPLLDYGGDEDGDDIRNGHDRLPYNDGYD